MSGFLIDTNVLSELVRKVEPQPQVKGWFESAAPTSLFASVMTFAEIRRGIELLPSGKRRSDLEQWLERELVESFENRLLPVTKAIADRWAVLSAQAQRRGKSLLIPDGLIAAAAIEHRLVIVTRNVKESLGIEIFNPWEM